MATSRWISTTVPWESCRSHEYENLIALCPNCHRQADTGDIDKKSLREYKNSSKRHGCVNDHGVVAGGIDLKWSTNVLHKITSYDGYLVLTCLVEGSEGGLTKGETQE